MAKKAGNGVQRTLSLKRTGGATWKVFVNGQVVPFAGNTATKKVAPGQHTIQWFVRGALGSGYSFEATGPPEAKFKNEAVFDTQGKDMGSAWVVVN